MFKFFDKDENGSINYEEFLSGIRGKLNERRLQMVLLAFDVLDKDKSGVIDLDDLTEMYDASNHPDVLAGKKKESAILREFLETFDGSDKDGKVSPGEFIKYYTNISASTDEDDYFELMMRNAWHIPGGEGWCANTANKRVLVVNPVTGEESIQCIENDLGMKTSDISAVKARLALNKGADRREQHTQMRRPDPLYDPNAQNRFGSSLSFTFGDGKENESLKTNNGGVSKKLQARVYASRQVFLYSPFQLYFKWT